MIRTQLFTILLLFASTGWFLQAQSLTTTVAATDLTLILRTWRVKGVLACPETCLWVENAFPVGLFEVTRRPFTSGIREFDALLGPLKGRSQITSSHTGPSDKSGSTLQFAESRVFELVHPLDVPTIARPEGNSIAVNYISELDSLGWRSPVPDLLLHPSQSSRLCDLPPRSKRVCAGPWGNYYPRHGFLIRDSEPLAAFLQALRGGRAASAPAGRVVLKPYPFEPRTGHWLQMVDPVIRRPVEIGDSDLASMERNALAMDGQYLFIHFGIFERCQGCLPGRLVGER